MSLRAPLITVVHDTRALIVRRLMPENVVAKVHTRVR